jgi:anti-anti-sigma factor
MDVREEQAGPICRFHVAGEMTIYTALDLKPRLLGALAGCTTLEVHGSDVTEVDSSGLQLLLLAKREAQAAGKQIQVLSPSQALQEAMQQFCLGPAVDPL